MIKVRLNNDQELVKEIREAIVMNDGYCCCALVHEPNTKCMCKEFRDRIERREPGECHCGLYVLETDEIENTNI